MADSEEAIDAIDKFINSEQYKNSINLTNITLLDEPQLPPAKKEKGSEETMPTEEQNSEQASAQENIPNTYGDLFDTPNLWINIDRTNGNRKEIYISENEVINSLEDLHHDIVEFPDNEEELIAEINKYIESKQTGPLPLKTQIKWEPMQLTLATYIQKMPHGIVDKQEAGIGATTLEINSKRHSIIVSPTKILAYTKYIKHKDKALYVGGKINEERDATNDKEIKEYLADTKLEYKKFLVVADSLPGLLEQIKTDDWKNYFLMIDEVDMIQSESNYRPKLEDLIDYYFQFPPKNRCLVTATMREFSNPRLQQECKFKLTWKDTPKRNIQLFYTDNLDALTAQHIQSLSHTNKILIAFNSIRHCKNIIKLLTSQMQKECSILCSTSSKNEAGDYYSELKPDNTLPQRINFITSCYFAGVDIEDSYHLITVSNAQQNYQMLSLDKMTQIYGRCRIPKGILSDTIIYNTRDDKQKNADKNYQNTLLKQAEAILQLQKAASELGKQDADLADLFQVVQTAIREKAAVQLPREKSIKLTRKNISDKNVTAYMNIDYLVERQKLCNTIYNSYKNLPANLKEQGHIVKSQYKAIVPSETQIKLDIANKKESDDIFDKQLLSAIDEIREILKQKGKITENDLVIYLSQKSCRKYVIRLNKLWKLADNETIMDKLWEIRHSDKRTYKNLKNAAVFWALDDKHPFKRDLLRVFKIGRKYKASEIQELTAPIVKYHLHKTIKQRASVSLLKALFLVERPKIYLIKGKNPMGFKKHGPLRIPRTEENLREYFLL